MYCIKCGVALADTEKQCPLCGTTVYHPELSREEEPSLYPQDRMPAAQVRPWGTLLIISILFLLPISICIVCDTQINGKMEWSGYVTASLLLLYAVAILPSWFHRPNPVIFVPVDFAAIGVFLLYINLATGGHWFMSFAFPVTGALGLIVTAVVALMRYLRKGKLFVCGGACLAMGGFMLLLEFLLHITFELPGIGTWSPYPLIVFSLLGLTMILIGICPPLRESLERKFFL
jgi:hypothetical protein